MNEMNEINRIKPMSLWRSILFFGIPTVLFYVIIYAIMPYLGESGVNPILNYSLTLTGPVILLFVASLVALKIDGYQLNWTTLKTRFRLKPIRGREWAWVFAFMGFYGHYSTFSGSGIY
jgi:hypothetical protein